MIGSDFDLYWDDVSLVVSGHYDAIAVQSAFVIGSWPGKGPLVTALTAFTIVICIVLALNKKIIEMFFKMMETL